MKELLQNMRRAYSDFCYDYRDLVEAVAKSESERELLDAANELDLMRIKLRVAMDSAGEESRRALARLRLLFPDAYNNQED